MSQSRVFFGLLSLLSFGMFALEEGDLKNDKGEVIVHYAVEAPKSMAPADTTDPTKQLGLIMCFHEHDGKAPDETHSPIESLARLNLSEQYVVIGMKDGTKHGYSPVDDHVRAEKLIAWAKKTYPINPRRVILWGRGEGAKFVGEFGPEHSDLVSAIITYSWGFRKSFDVKNPELNIPDFYIVLGLKDAPHHLKWVRDTFALAKAHGYNTIYREAEGLGGATKHPLTNDDAILWATSTRHKTMALSESEAALLKPFSTEAAAHALAPDSTAFAAIATVGGRQAGAVLNPVFDAENEATRIAAIQLCEHGNFGPDTAAALAKKIKDSSTAVRHAAIIALGVQANWRNLPAQVALCELATDKAARIAERALAMDAIAKAVALQIKGSYQDLPLFKALIEILDDEDPALRAKAFTILAPIMHTEYEPDAAKEARDASIVKWNEWLETLPAKQAAAAAAPLPAPKKKENTGAK